MDPKEVIKMKIEWYTEKLTEIHNALQNQFSELPPHERTLLTTGVLAEIAKDKRIKQMKEDREKQYQRKQLSDNAPPTQKQLKWLEKMGENPQNYKTKKQASDKLDKLFGEKK